MAALGFEEACVKYAKGEAFSEQYARARDYSKLALIAR